LITSAVTANLETTQVIEGPQAFRPHAHPQSQQITASSGGAQAFDSSYNGLLQSRWHRIL